MVSVENGSAALARKDPQLMRDNAEEEISWDIRFITSLAMDGAFHRACDWPFLNFLGRFQDSRQDK
jgi:hypothetical protein